MSDLYRKANQGQPRLGRQCGPCQLCCTGLEIVSRPGYSTRLDTGEDLAKPAGRPCQYLGPQGCQIYQVRPVVCRQFACDWLMALKGHALEDSPLVTRSIGVRGNQIKV